MVQYYTVFGRQVGSHVLAMGVLFPSFAGIGWSLRSPKTADNSPAINAKNADEEKFVKDFIKAKADGASQH